MTRKGLIRHKPNQPTTKIIQQKISFKEMCYHHYYLGLRWCHYHIFRKSSNEYKFTKSQVKINHQLFYGWYQIVCQKWKRIGNPITDSEVIQSGHRDRIWHRKMRYIDNEKSETAHDGRNKTIKPRKDPNARRIGNLQKLGNIGNGHHQTNGDEEKI